MQKGDRLKYMRYILIATLFVSLTLMACQPQNMNPSTSPSPSSSPSSQKVGTTTKTGVIAGKSGAYFLQESGQPPLALDSYSLDLNAYVGQTVTVSGQYSGNTLFIGSIQ